MVTAHTITYSSVVTRMLVECYISVPNTPAGSDGAKLKALWDTGATVTCISTTLVTKLSLPIVDRIDITVANNKKVGADVHCVQIRMDDFVVPCINVAALDMTGSGYDAIIGMDFMINGDTHISHYGGRTVLTFRQPSLETCDFVAEGQEVEKCRKIHEINIKKRLPDKCACGSGRDYKNCHGKSIYNKQD